MSLIGHLLHELGSDDPRWYLGPYFIMCCIILFAIVVYPFADTFIGLSLLRLIMTGLLLGALYTVSRSRGIYWTSLVLLVPTLLIYWTVDYGEYPALTIAASSVTLLILFFAIVRLLTFVLTARRVSPNIIFGSVAIYLLFGIFWALAFELLNEIMPGTVIASVGEIVTAESRALLFQEFSYFSFITLTSVGYGDLAPISNQARGLAMVEGVFGQLYTAILIAKLVGLWVAQE